MEREPEVELRPAHIRAFLALAEARHLTGYLGHLYGPGFLWPGFVFGDIPVILYRGSGEAFLVQHPDPPDTFRPVRIPVPGLQGVSLGYHRGSLPYLPAVGSVVVAGRDCATLPISVFHPGAVPESLVAGLIHEAFHAFTTGLRPTKPNRSLLASYPELSPVNNALGNMEALILHDYLARTSGAPIDANRVAYLFSLVRRERRVPLEDEIISYEQQLEAGEGLARYVEMRSLLGAAPVGTVSSAGGDDPGPDTEVPYVPGRAFETLSGRRAYDRAPELLYQKVARLLQVNLNGAGAAWWRFYHTGMALALLADRVAPGWKRRVEAGEALDSVIGEHVLFDGGAGDERELEVLKQHYGYDERLDAERAFSRAERRRKEDLLASILGGSGTRVTFDVSSLVAEETWWDTGRVKLAWDPAAVEVITSNVRIHSRGLRFRGFGTDLRFSGVPVVEDAKNRLFHVNVPALGLTAEGDGQEFSISQAAEFEDGLDVALPGVQARARSGYVRNAEGALYIKITR